MAETANILSPHKTVLIPDQRAGCSLADSITSTSAVMTEYPGAVVVSYWKRARNELRLSS